MAKVCYIHPSSAEKPKHWVMAAGIFGILDIIQRKGFQVEALNYPMELYLNEEFDLNEWLRANVAKYYLVGLHWFVHAKGAHYIVQSIRKANKDAIIIMGGITTTLFYEFLMRDISEIDYMVVGDGEEPIPQLLEALEEKKPIHNIANLVYRENGTVLRSKNKYILNDFQGLVYSNYSFLHNKEQYPVFSYPGALLDERSLWLVTGRGCIYSCIGCGAAKNARLGRESYCENGFLIRSVKDIIQDIDNLKGFDLDFIKLTHDLGSVSRDYYETFFKSYKDLNIKTKIYNEFWQVPTEEFITTAIESGLEEKMDFAITAHTGDEIFRKKFGKEYTNQELLKCLIACIQAKFTVKLYFSRYLPGENAKSLIQSLKLIQKIKDLDRNSEFIQIIYEPYLTDPCSIMRKDSSLEEDYDSYINWNSEKKDQVIYEAFYGMDAKAKVIDKRIWNLVYRNEGDV